MVQSALPAIDDRAPLPRPHVAVKLKQCQREVDRKEKIKKDNFSLLQRLNAIMREKRLDNCWTKPLPDFRQKVGLFYDLPSIRSRVTARAASLDTPSITYAPLRCYACELKKRRSAHINTCDSLGSEDETLPPLFLKKLLKSQ